MNCVCSVVTYDYLDKAIAAFESMRLFNPEERFYALVIGDVDLSDARKKLENRNVFLVGCDFLDDPTSQLMMIKYDGDKQRWSLKSSLILKLLQTYDKVLCVDSDLYFVDDYDFIYDDLDEYGILITPHWRPKSPKKSTFEFYYSLTHGNFNAGFMGVSKKGIKAIEWWKELCAWKCENNPDDGLYVDQRYLDLMPIFFSDVCKVVEHRGCNVAAWNIIENKRVEINGDILINGKWPVVFVHMTAETLEDRSLKKYIEDYFDLLKNVDEFQESLGIHIDPPPSKNYGIFVYEKDKLSGPIESRFYTDAQSLHALKWYKNGKIPGHSKARKYVRLSLKQITQSVFSKMNKTN